MYAQDGLKDLIRRERTGSNIKAYQIEMRDKVFIFKTTSFGTEGGSVLHSGIFNRELASSLAAGAVITVVGFLFAGHFEITFLHFVISIFLFATLFIVFRIYVFREPLLETIFDSGRKIITLSFKKVIGTDTHSYPMEELSGIRLGHVTLQPQNIDGIRVVEKIALQHGTVIPGLGKRQDIYTVQLDFRGEKVTIFSTKERHSAETAADELKRHMNMTVAGSEA